MEKKDYRLRGHESFILREGWLTKGLMAVSQDAHVFSKNSGADALGVGTNMAKAIRYWLRAAGLIDDVQRNGAQLTELGKLIYECDPYLEDITSLWIIHANIARNFKLATSWSIFFNNIEVTTFKRDELIKMMTEHVMNITGETKVPERSVRDDCSAILSMYAGEKETIIDPEEKKSSPFRVLGLVHEIENNQYEKRRPAMDQLDSRVVLYVFAEVLNAEGVISIDDLVDTPDMPGKLFNLNRVAINDYLDALQNNEYIIVNRTAGLDVVYPNKCVSPLMALQDHYEGRKTK